MATQKCAMYYGRKDIRIEDRPIPKPRSGEVLVEIGWCGICGSDLHEYMDGPIFCPVTPHKITGDKNPICMGHEFAGAIKELGPDIKGDWKVGDRVIVEPVISCSECYACKNDAQNACESLGFVGLSGLGGGLSQYSLSKESYLHKIPDNMSMKSAAMIEPLAVAYHAVMQSGLKKGDSVLVLGSGPIGVFTILVCKALGASTVIVSEPSVQRRKKAEEAGADHIWTPLETDVVAETRKVTGGAGVDISFDCAGVQSSLETALKGLHPKGVCVNVAIWAKPASVDMNSLLVLVEKTLKGVIGYHKDHPPAIELVSSGKINLEPFITATIPLADLVTKGFHELIHNNENHVKILVNLTGKDQVK